MYPAREVHSWLAAVGLGATRDLALPAEFGPGRAIFARAATSPRRG